MKHTLLKISPVAAMLVTSNCMAQEPAPSATPAAAAVPVPEPVPAPAAESEPLLPELNTDLNPVPAFGVMPEKKPSAYSGSNLMDAPFTNKQDPTLLTVEPVNLTGITLFADKRNSAKEPAQRWEISQKEVLPAGVQLVGGLNTPDPKHLNSALNSYIKAGKPATFKDLQSMVGIIEDHYRHYNRPMTHVYIPRQSIYSDKVVISIVEGRIGETLILTEADVRSKPPAQWTASERNFIKRMDEESNWWNSWYNNPYKAKDVSAEVFPRTAMLKGRLVDTEEIRAQITGMNRSPWARLNRPITHPFRDVSVNFSQPAENIVGQTNLIFEVDDKRPLKFFTGMDNTLTDQTGNNRIFLGAAWYDACGLGLNHEIGVQFFSALDYSELAGVSLNYQIPWQDEKFNQFTELYTAYADSTSSLDLGGIPVDAGGGSFSFGARHYLELPDLLGASDLSQPLGANREFKWADPIREPMGLYHEVGLGFDYKSLDNTLQFGGDTVSDSPADICQLVLEYNTRQTDPTGESNLTTQLFFSPGNISGDNTDEAFSPLRSDAKAAYLYAQMRVEREQDLPVSGYFDGMMLRGALTGQYSNANLLASEQLGLGGYGSVRGYPERILRGDSGVIFNLELFSPRYHPTQAWFKGNAFDELKFLVFFDYAHGAPYKDSAADPLDDAVNLMSVGVGMRYNYNDTLQVRLDYGSRIEDLPVAADNSDSGAVHFGVVGTF